MAYEDAGAKRRPQSRNSKAACKLARSWPNPTRLTDLSEQIRGESAWQGLAERKRSDEAAVVACGVHDGAVSDGEDADGSCP